MTHRMKESTAEGCACPRCGSDIGPEGIFHETDGEIDEIYYYPACRDCGIYCNKHDKSHWYPEE